MTTLPSRSQKCLNYYLPLVFLHKPALVIGAYTYLNNLLLLSFADKISKQVEPIFKLTSTLKVQDDVINILNDGLRKKIIIIIIGNNLHVFWGSLPFEFIQVGACEPHTVYPSLAFTIALHS